MAPHDKLLTITRVCTPCCSPQLNCCYCFSRWVLSWVSEVSQICLLFFTNSDIVLYLLLLEVFIWIQLTYSTLEMNTNRSKICFFISTNRDDLGWVKGFVDFSLALCTKSGVHEYVGREHQAWNFQANFFFFPFKHHAFQQSIYDWCCKVMNHNAKYETY